MNNGEREKESDALLLGLIEFGGTRVSLAWAQGYRDLELPEGSTYRVARDLPYGPARNALAKEALDGGYHLAFLDLDMLVAPGAFMRLLETGCDVVSGLYYGRRSPHEALLYEAGEGEREIWTKPVKGWMPGEVVAADLVPTGLMLIRHHVLAQMFDAFPLPFYWGLDVAGVPDFPDPASGQPKEAVKMSEDFTFSWRLKQMGIQPYVHTGVVALHETQALVGPPSAVQGVSMGAAYGIIHNH